MAPPLLSLPLLVTSALLLLVSHPLLSSGFKAVSFDGCRRIKGCMMSSPSCTPDTCQYAATWRTIRTDGKEYLEIELVGDVRSKNGYVALGFSEDRLMGNDGVVGCLHDSSTNTVQIRAAFNKDKTKMNAFLRSSDIDEDFLIPDTYNTREGSSERTTDRLYGGSFSSVTNRIQCRFSRLVKPSRSVQQVKDLSSDFVYYLLVSRGTFVSGSGFSKHFPGGEVVSNEAFALPVGYPSSLTSSGGVNSPSAKAHGCMMVLAWVLCASVGIIMARYYKDMWPNSGLIGERIWFQTHRILQSICVILTCLGFIVIFIYAGGYSKVDVWPLYIHPILGIIVFILTLINPFIALCRCRPGAKNRPVFNWIHFFVGTIAYVLSVPTMMLGFRMAGSGLQLSSIDYPLWILIFFCIFQFCVEIILEIHGCMYYRKNKDKRHNYEMEMDEYMASVKTGPQAKPREPEPSGRTFKYFMIGLHATVSAIVAVVLVIIIAVN